MGKKPVRPFGPDCPAAATRYHAGQSNAQLTTPKASLLHAEIISTDGTPEFAFQSLDSRLGDLT
jgi:hypothetical protein